MTRYRCVVFQSTGNYVPYSGMSFKAASDAFEDYRGAGLRITVERNDGDGWLEAISYQPGRV